MNTRSICMLTTFYPPYNFGGDGMWVYRLSNALARTGHPVTVVFNPAAYRLLSNAPVEHAFPNHPGITLRPLSEARWGRAGMLVDHQIGIPIAHRDELVSILDSGFDVLHFHNISLLGGPGVLSLGNGLKLVTFNDHWFVCAMHILWRFDREACSRRTCFACTLRGRRPPQFWRYTRRLERALEHVDAFITPSAAAVRSHHANGFPKPIRVMPYFMPPHRSNAGNGAEIPQLRLVTGRFFLYAGRLEKMKGVQVLIDVFRRYRRADLVIAGTGTYAAGLENLADGLEHVHFTGFQPTSVLSGLYRRTLATLVPSIGYETFGFTSLESMSHGTPAIVHDFGPLPEVVSGGGGLVYRTPDELVGHMDRIIDDPDFRSALARRGRENYDQNFSEQGHIASYHALLKELFETG